MDTLTLITLTTVILLIIGGITALRFARRRPKNAERLQRQFGREHERTVDTLEDETTAEAGLPERVKHARSLDLIPLTGEQTAEYLIEWEALEEDLQRDPHAAAQETEHLIRSAMHAKGYPVESYDQFISDLSVDYPEHVTKYQALHELVAGRESETASPEELRRVVHECRALVEEILDIELVEKSYPITR